MKIYNYDKNTKEYLSTAIATENPLKKGAFLIPSNSTSKIPLPKKDGYAVCFHINKWEYVIDNRDKTYYKDHEIVKFKLGDIITDDMSEDEFTEQEIFEITKKDKVSNLNRLCSLFIQNRFRSDALGSIHYYQSSRDDQANLVSDVLADIDLDIKCSADIENYEFITHTALEVKKVSDDFTLFRIEALKKVNDLKELVNNATTKEDIESIVW